MRILIAFTLYASSAAAQLTAQETTQDFIYQGVDPKWELNTNVDGAQFMHLYSSDLDLVLTTLCKVALRPMIGPAP